MVEAGKAGARDAERRKLRFAWIGLCTYIFVLLNGFRLIGKLPWQISVLGAALNAAIVTVLILAMRKSYRKLKNDNDSPQSDR
jgi:hypothetical protein